jgi:hypothetical protein
MLYATLYYAGLVVIAFEDPLSIGDCHLIGQHLMYQIQETYNDPEAVDRLADTEFFTDQWSFSCEREPQIPDIRFMN